MAGHRRSRGQTYGARRYARRRRELEQRLAAATTPLARVHAAIRYVTGALRRAPQQTAAPAAEEIVRFLTHRGDRLLDPERRTTPNDR